jgi:cyclic pyranopterin monophosphate synthase
MTKKKSSRLSRQLSHYDARGRARMVDVSAKARTVREAEASALVRMTPQVIGALAKNPKGDPLEVARMAGIMAAKRTAELIPMCHPVALAYIDVTLRVCENGVSIATIVKTAAETGVEMEALVAASVAALTVYDMCKALDKGIEITEVMLERKSGGKSGEYRRRAKRK